MRKLRSGIIARITWVTSLALLRATTTAYP